MRLFSRLVNMLKRWLEDRSVPEASTVQQWKQVWGQRPIYRNLKLVRGEPGKIMRAWSARANSGLGIYRVNGWR